VSARVHRFRIAAPRSVGNTDRVWLYIDRV